jgi:hypothetical protein
MNAHIFYLLCLESISKIGFWFKIPSSPLENRGFAETGEAPIPSKKAGGQKTFLRWVLASGCAIKSLAINCAKGYCYALLF